MTADHAAEALPCVEAPSEEPADSSSLAGLLEPEAILPEVPAPLAEARDEEGPDLFSLFGGLLALTQEVRIEGRNVRRLEERLAPLAEELPDALARAADMADEQPARLAEARRDGHLEGRLETLAEILDVRDRLARSLAAVRARLARPRGLVACLVGDERACISALADGVAGALERVDEVLRTRDVRELSCEGRAFDAKTMRAVDVGPVSTEHPAGTVIEVYRAGYLAEDRCLRPAEVKVAKA